MRSALRLAGFLAIGLAGAQPRTASALAGPHAALPGYPTGYCLACHPMRGGGPPTPTATCLYCHSETPTKIPGATLVVAATPVGQHNALTTGTGRFEFSLDCATCHDPHDHVEAKYIRSNIAASITVTDNSVDPPETFTKAIDATVSFAAANDFDNDDGDPTNDVCNVCHTRTNHHQNDGAAPGGQDHFNGTDCTGCHSHDQGFAWSFDPTFHPQADNDCGTCHDDSSGQLELLSIHLDQCSLCHDAGFTGTILGPFGTFTNDCNDCHGESGPAPNALHPTAIDAPHSLIGAYAAQACSACHSSVDAGLDSTTVCLECHGDAPSNVDAIDAHSHAGASGRFDFSLPCMDCHNPHEQEQDAAYGTAYGKYVKTTIDAAITVTDNTASPPATITKTVSSAVVFTGPDTFANSDSDYAGDICNTCHTLTDHHQAGGTAPGGQSHFDGADCTVCHSHLGGFAFDFDMTTHPQAASASCRSCHAAADGSFDLPGIHSDVCSTCHPTDTSSTLLGPIGSWDGECTGCHDASIAPVPHATVIDAPHSDIPGFATNDCAACHDIVESGLTATETCLSCHGETPSVVSATLAAEHGHLVTGSTDFDFEVGCMICHDPHEQHQDDTWGTDYGMYLRTNIQADLTVTDWTVTPPETFTKTIDATVQFTGPTEFDDGDGDPTNDVCNVCHTRTNHHQNDGMADGGQDHFNGMDCVNCHPHDAGFSPGEGGDCTVCHDAAQGPTGERRQVVGGGGDFARASHHVSDGTTAEVVTFDDCAVCHDQSRHGSIDDPGVFLNDPDGGTPFEYDGTGASVEDFCAACHDDAGPEAFDADDDASNGNQPFSDLEDPPGVATDWYTASHATTTRTALATDACLACHGGADSTASSTTTTRNAHGSALANLASAKINGATVINAEEDLCFACHDATGSSTNIEAEFAKGTNGTYIYHHPVYDSQQVGARAVECADCHSPHAATAGEPLAGVSGVDLSGATIAAGEPIDEFEVCLKCHGDTYNSSRSRATNKRTDFAANSSSTHAVGAAGRNRSTAMKNSLRGGLTIDSVLECSDCHNTNATSSVVGSVSNYTGTSPVGTHGSTTAWILRAAYPTAITATTWSTSTYALCFACHDSARLFSDSGTNFKLHKKHIEGEDATCAYCHYNTHGNRNSYSNTNYRINGTTYTSGPPTGFKTRNVSFAPGVSTAVSGYSKPTFRIDTSTRKRYCYLRCHGKDHTPKDYTPSTSLDNDSLTY